MSHSNNLDIVILLRVTSSSEDTTIALLAVLLLWITTWQLVYRGWFLKEFLHQDGFLLHVGPLRRVVCDIYLITHNLLPWCPFSTRINIRTWLQFDIFLLFHLITIWRSCQVLLRRLNLFSFKSKLTMTLRNFFIGLVLLSSTESLLISSILFWFNLILWSLFVFYLFS